MKVLDLFSGIGGMALGLERAGMETIAFCEIDPYCQKILRKHWPDVPIYPDIRGFPLPRFVGCRQEKRADGPTELISRQVDWIVIENVSHTWRHWVPKLRGFLHGCGYSSLPLLMSASELGAPHHRKRVFVIANPDSEQLRKLAWWWQWEGRKVAHELGQHWKEESELSGVDDGVSSRLDRNRVLGNSVVPQLVEVIGRAILEAENGS